MQSASIAIALGALAAVGTLRAAAIWAPKRPISAPIRSSEARRRFTIIASSKSALRNQTKFNLNGARRRADLTVRRQPRYKAALAGLALPFQVSRSAFLKRRVRRRPGAAVPAAVSCRRSAHGPRKQDRRSLRYGRRTAAAGRRARVGRRPLFGHRSSADRKS